MEVPFDTTKINEIVTTVGMELQRFSQDPKMREPKNKTDGSPVTASDLALSRQIHDLLSPFSYLVVTEEDLPETQPGPDESYFIIDPLDGTKYYSRGEPEFCLCVGFIWKGKPYYGGIFDPINAELYWAVKGQGAFCDLKPISHGGPPQGLRVFSSGFHKIPERKKTLVEHFGIQDILELGSALKFCAIARGDADLYLRRGPTSEWDTAAAQVLLEEAGCFLVELETLEPIEYGKKNYLNRGLLAGHKSLLKKTTDFVRQYGVKPTSN